MDNKRLTIVVELLKGYYREFLKPQPDVSELSEIAIAWLKNFDDLKVPDEHILPLYRYAVDTKDDSLGFAIKHIRQAWPKYKQEMANKRLKKDVCKYCGGFGIMKIYDPINKQEKNETCWINHFD